MTPVEIDTMLKALTQKDLRIQLRARNESPAGSIEVLRDRLKDAMIASKDFALKNDDGSDMATVHVVAGTASSELSEGNLKNNYVRPAGQNVGNFLTDRNSSRVLAPPGGGSQVRGDLNSDCHQSQTSCDTDLLMHVTADPVRGLCRPQHRQGKRAMQ